MSDMEMENKDKKPLFERLAAINVNDLTEKKNNLTYLSWAHAWGLFKKEVPDASYRIYSDPETGNLFTHCSPLGIMVKTTVTANGETLEMWLPVMDGANKAQRFESYTYKVKAWDKKVNKYVEVEKSVHAATMFDVNKTIMRCLAKNLAMFGLGLYIYAGEDLPAEEEEPKRLQEIETAQPYEDRNLGCVSWRQWTTAKGNSLGALIDDSDKTNEQKHEILDALITASSKALASAPHSSEEEAARTRDIEFITDAKENV